MSPNGCTRCWSNFQATGDMRNGCPKPRPRSTRSCRPLVYRLGQAGFYLSLVSSIAVARTREALCHSWKSKDPNYAQVILRLLKNGTTQPYLEPLVTVYQNPGDADTYQPVSLRKMRIHHSLVTDHLPLYFSGAEPYLHRPRADGLPGCCFTACPAAVRSHRKEDAFVEAAGVQIGGGKVDTLGGSRDFYDTARRGSRPTRHTGVWDEAAVSRGAPCRKNHGSSGL
jgi:hypothetical protein